MSEHSTPPTEAAEAALKTPAARPEQVSTSAIPAATGTPVWMPVALAAACVLGAVSLTWAWQLHSRLKNLEPELVKRQESSQNAASEARQLARQSQDLTRDTAAKVALIDARLAEVALQRGQLEELIQSMSRSRDENVVGDIDASVRVAIQQSSITGSVEPLMAALRQADERLARYKQPRLEGVRRAVVRDLDRVKAVSVVDSASLAIKLDEAVRLADELPMLSAANQTDNAARASRPAKADRATPAVKAASAEPLAGWQSSVQWVREQWADLWGQVWGETKSLVRVTRIAHPEAALLAPEQAFFLRENLKLRLLNARLALMSRQFDTAQSDLNEALNHLSRYFDPNAKNVRTASDLLRQVAGQARQVTVPRPDDTLAALAAVGR